MKTAPPFEIVYADAKGEKKAVSGLQVRLIRERRDYYWNWSESEGWQSQFEQKRSSGRRGVAGYFSRTNGESELPVEGVLIAWKLKGRMMRSAACASGPDTAGRITAMARGGASGSRHHEAGQTGL